MRECGYAAFVGTSPSRGYKCYVFLAKSRLYHIKTLLLAKRLYHINQIIIMISMNKPVVEPLTKSNTNS